MENAEAKKSQQPGHSTNRLIDATSPYLLQHARNPVDWYPWGPEARERSKRENKVIFLSIGYAACHWCHVMERETFENERIAQYMNEHFINIKVDREERPDLDEIYMLATQIVTGRGGWPMSVWLTPEGQPFYAGTYFPPDDRPGMPGFKTLLVGLAEAWKTHEPQMREQAGHVVAAVRRHAAMTGQASDSRPDIGQWVGAAIEAHRDRFDGVNGGFGGAPKFPPSQALLFWLELLRQADGPAGPLGEAPGAAEGETGSEAISRGAGHRLSVETRKAIETMVCCTLDRMAAGGMHDQVGGGFARYSVDATWLVPHFEKMLYDNAQLAMAYAMAAKQFGRVDYERVARRTLDFFLREMVHPEGGFYSSLDADSEGVEGKYYIWTIDELKRTLPDGDDADLIIQHLGLTARGNFESANVLHVAASVNTLAARRGAAPGKLQARIDALLLKLRAERSHRIRPGLDDKILLGWNGLMVSALSTAGRLLKEPRYLEAAHRAIGYVLIRHAARPRGLWRVSRDGKAHVPAFLEDYAYLLAGLMDLIASTTSTSLAGTMARRRAVDLADAMIDQFGDADGGFEFQNKTSETLFAHVKTIMDNATPSPNALAVRALLRLARVSGMRHYHEVAMKAACRFAHAVEQHPDQCATLLAALLEDGDHGALEDLSRCAAESGRLAGDAMAPEAPHVSLACDEVPSLRPGDRATLYLRLSITKDMYIHPATLADSEMFATVARVRCAPLVAGPALFPVPEHFTIGGHETVGYRDTVLLQTTIEVPAGTPPGTHSLRAIVMAQPCGQSFCLPPERVALDIPVRVIQ